MKYSIFTTHYAESDAIPCKGIYPIQVGKALTKKELFPLNDFSADNISAKNPEYCELTAQYWVWKNNCNSEYIGFMHYRRHVSFRSDNKKEEDAWGLIEYDKIDSKYLNECGFEPEIINKALDGYDILIAKEWDVTNSGNKNNYELYKNTPFLHIEDYNKAIRIVSEMYPDYDKAMSEYNRSKKGFYTNIFVMRKEIYKEYSEWLFSILEKLESELNFSSYSNVERRVIGHIAERLLGVYIYKKREEGVLKIKELRRTLVKNVDCNINYPTPSFLDENTPIVLNFNNNYAKVAGALIQSITEFSSSKKNYDFFVLGNNIDEGNKEKLELIIKPYKNMRISYIDMNKFNLFDNLHVSGHFSKETYYRLYIPKIFSNFEKVIYIDADMIVQKDLNDLIQIDLDGKPIAAVQCYIMQLMINNKVLSSYESGSMPADLYVKNYLNLDRGEDYFQAGLLVMDIEKLRRLDFVNKAEKLILEQNFWFLDQDIMNCILNGNVKFIEYNWNTLHGNEIENNLEKILPIQYRSLYLDAKNEPYIIHYAGENKPWINRHVYFSNIWWAYFTKTGWYTSEVLLRLEQLETSPHIKYGNSVFIKIRNNLIKVINKIFPVGSKRRVFLVKQYRYIRQNIK